MAEQVDVDHGVQTSEVYGKEVLGKLRGQLVTAKLVKSPSSA